MPGPGYRSKEWKKKHGRRPPSQIAGDGGVRPLTRSEMTSPVAAQPTSLNTSRPSRGDYGRRGGVTPTSVDSPMAGAGKTGLSKSAERKAHIAFEPDAGPGHLVEALTNIALTAAPGGLAVKGAALAPRLLKAARAAEDAGDVVNASKLLRASEKAAASSKRTPPAARRARNGGKARGRSKRARDWGTRRRSRRERHPEDLGWSYEIATRYGLVPSRALADTANLHARIVNPAVKARRAWRGATLTPAYSAIASSKGAEIADWYRDTGTALYRALADKEYAERLRRLQALRTPEENRAALLRVMRRYGGDE